MGRPLFGGSQASKLPQVLPHPRSRTNSQGSTTVCPNSSISLDSLPTSAHDPTQAHSLLQSLPTSPSSQATLLQAHNHLARANSALESAYIRLHEVRNTLRHMERARLPENVDVSLDRPIGHDLAATPSSETPVLSMSDASRSPWIPTTLRAARDSSGPPGLISAEVSEHEFHRMARRPRRSSLAHLEVPNASASSFGIAQLPASGSQPPSPSSEGIRPRRQSADRHQNSFEAQSFQSTRRRTLELHLRDPLLREGNPNDPSTSLGRRVAARAGAGTSFGQRSSEPSVLAAQIAGDLQRAMERLISRRTPSISTGSVSDPVPMIDGSQGQRSHEAPVVPQRLSRPLPSNAPAIPRADFPSSGTRSLDPTTIPQRRPVGSIYLADRLPFSRTHSTRHSAHDPLDLSTHRHRSSGRLATRSARRSSPTHRNDHSIYDSASGGLSSDVDTAPNQSDSNPQLPAGGARQDISRDSVSETEEDERDPMAWLLPLRRQRTSPLVDANGDEVSTDIQGNVDGTDRESRPLTASPIRVTNDPSVARRTRAALVPTTRLTLPTSNNEATRVHLYRGPAVTARVRVPSIREPHRNSPSSFDQVEGAGQVYYGSDVPYNIEPLPIPLDEMIPSLYANPPQKLRGVGLQKHLSLNPALSNQEEYHISL